MIIIQNVVEWSRENIKCFHNFNLYHEVMVTNLRSRANLNNNWQNVLCRLRTAVFNILSPSC